jgi:hypothetical protein
MCGVCGQLEQCCQGSYGAFVGLHWVWSGALWCWVCHTVLTTVVAGCQASAKQEVLTESSNEPLLSAFKGDSMSVRWHRVLLAEWLGAWPLDSGPAS